MLNSTFDKRIMIVKRKQLFFFLSWLHSGSVNHMKRLFVIFQCDCNFLTTIRTKGANYAKHWFSFDCGPYRDMSYFLRNKNYSVVFHLMNVFILLEHVLIFIFIICSMCTSLLISQKTDICLHFFKLMPAVWSWGTIELLFGIMTLTRKLAC